MSLVIGGLGQPELPVLSSATDDLADAIAYMGGGNAASAGYPAANLAIFVPVRISQPRTYVSAWWLNGATAAGNVDVGLYTMSGTTLTRVAASTAEAQSGVSAMQVAATFPSTTVGPGLYYLALSCTSATATFWKTAPQTTIARDLGVFQAAASSPLPSTATAAAWSQTLFVPVFGLSELSTI